MNINANLIKARDGAAPQHKIKGQNRFEATEGSDGAQHIKIVDHNGNPISSNNRLPVDVSFPGTQNVKDDDVKAELEQIKNRLNDKIEVEQSEIAINNLPTDYPDSQVKVELELIKAQQIAINNKLDSIIENDAINTRVTGSNVEKLAVGAVTKTRMAMSVNGIQVDGTGTSTSKLPADTVENVLSVSGAGEIVTLVLITDTVDYSVGFSIKMDGRDILPVMSGAQGRYHSLRYLDRVDLTTVGSEFGLGRVIKWTESARIVEFDLSKLGYFQDSLDINLENKTTDTVALSAMTFYKVIASPEINSTSIKDVSTDFIRRNLARKYGNKDDFTVTKTTGKGDEGNYYIYTVFYRVNVHESEMKNYVKTLFN